YGFIEPDGTPLEGLSEVEMSRTGYRLGMEHLRDDPPALVDDVVEGSVELYRPPFYAAYYSTRERTPGGGPFPSSVEPGVHRAARSYARAWLAFAAVAIVGLVRLRRHPRVLAPIAAFIVINWIGFAVVFWAMPRY